MGDYLRVRFLSLLAILWMVWPDTAFAQSPTRGLRAERFDVSLTLLADGSVEVRETVVFHFTEKTFSRLEREIPIDRFDDVIDVRASIDGHPVAQDDSSEKVRIRKGRNRLRVTWEFPGTINRSRAFTLEYRAMGALSVANGRAVMDWFVLPTRHRYVIDHARVEWRVPSTARRVQPTRIDDERWMVVALPDGWSATRQGVGVDESARLSDAFELSSMAVTLPMWQANAFRARQMAPAFVVCAVTLFVAGVGVVAMTWFRYRVPSREPGNVEPAQIDELPPAMGTALLRGSVGIGTAQMQATLLDLARRGVLQITESRDNPKRFDVVMPKPAADTPHEEILTSALRLHMKSGRVDLRTAWRHLTRALPAFRKSLLTEMQQAGLVDGERRWAARGLRIGGIVVILLGVGGLALFQILFGHLGGAPLTVPAAIIMSGLLFCIAGGVMPVLSPAGVAAAERWRARRTVIKSATKGTMSAHDVERLFPVAAGFGLAQSMLKAGKGSLASGASAFDWLGPVNHPGGALAAIIATTSSGTHGGGAGIGGGGAAGGGSSSAS